MFPAPQIDGHVVRRLEDGDRGVLETAFCEDPDFFLDINGRWIPIEEICTALPPRKAAADKFLFVIERDGKLVGMIDVIRDYPDPAVWHLGFLYVLKGQRGGLGRLALRAIQDWARAGGALTLRLGVVEQNVRARWLYATEGFVFETVREPDPTVNRVRRTLVLRRRL